MSFLAPLFLLGGLAIGLPVLFHLIRRTTRERTIFSSLMFLVPTPPRLTRRSRLEHLLLLALRCLVICLFALAFSRPFVKKPPGTEPPSSVRRVVVLVDTSASMRRPDLWTEARAAAELVFRKAAPSDQLALFSFDRRLTPLMGFEQWNAAPSSERAAMGVQKLSQVSPSWSSTHLGNALIQAAEILADSGKTREGPLQIVVISDLQEGSHLEPLQGYEWPKGIELTLVPLKPKHAGNASLQLVNEAEDGDPKAAGIQRVRVSNSSDAKSDQFKLGWAQEGGLSFAGKPLEGYVPPGQSRIFTLPTAAGDSPVDRIVLRGDEADFDNTAFTVAPRRAELTVAYLGTESAEDSKQPLYFLERALQDTRHQKVKILALKATEPLPSADLPSINLFVATAPLSDELANTIREQLAAGKTMFYAAKTEGAAKTIGNLLTIGDFALQEAPTNTYAMFASVDFAHPLFAPFADARFSDFSKIHFWRHRRFDAKAINGARVLAAFDNGDPALVEVSIGRGRLLLLASGWQPDDSQLALSTKFVPLLYSMLEWAGATVSRSPQYVVGDVVPLGTASGSGAASAGYTVSLPDSSKVTLESSQTNFTQTVLPGIYAVSAPGGIESRFAVNVDASEGRTAPAAADELEHLGAPMFHPTTPTLTSVQRQHLQNAELENRQKLWRWFILAVLVLLLVETWLAGFTTRRLADTQPQTS